MHFPFLLRKLAEFFITCIYLYFTVELTPEKKFSNLKRKEVNGTTYCRANFMIGDILRKEREKQKLSLRDVEEGTSIRSVYLEALEKGEYDKLPGEVYAKGFIKNYGNFLELNGEDLVRQFIIEITPVASAIEDSQPENLNSENKIAAKNISQKYPSKQTDSTENVKSDSRKYLAAAVALIAVLFGGIFYAFSGSDSETVEVAQKEKVTAPAAEKPAVEPQQVAQVVEVPQTPPPAPVAPPPVNDVNLQATFSGDCWTRVIVDGNVAFEGMFNAGQTQAWKGNQSISVLVGNAGAAQFTMNGENIGTLGGAGAVVRRTFTIN